MREKDKNISVEMLAERAKELECLYLIDKALTKESISDMLLEIVDVTTTGFRYVDACVVTVCLDNKVYSKKNQLHDGHEIRADIKVNDKVRWYIKASYPCDIAYKGESAFLIQETKLLNAIADRISQNIFQRQFVTL
jgi:pyruvate,water dikinase